jgi:hypothetical protein
LAAEQRQWVWYQQVLDAVCALCGLGVIITMAYRREWDALGVLTSLALLGYVSARSVTRWLVGRLNGDNGR